MTDFIDVEEKEEVEITEITGFSVNEYKGTPQFTVYGSVERVESHGEKEWQEQEVSRQLHEEPEPTLTIDSDDLPF